MKAGTAKRRKAGFFFLLKRGVGGGGWRKERQGGKEVNGGLEIDGAIVDCRSALISAAQGCCLRELASSSALKSLSLPRRDETRPNLATRMRLSIPAPLSQQPSPSPVPIFLFSALVLSAFSHFSFAWWRRPAERVSLPLQTASGELEVSSGRREKVAVGGSAGPGGGGGSEVILQQDGRRGLLLFPLPFPPSDLRGNNGTIMGCSYSCAQRRSWLAAVDSRRG